MGGKNRKSTSFLNCLVISFFDEVVMGGLYKLHSEPDDNTDFERPLTETTVRKLYSLTVNTDSCIPNKKLSNC